MIVIGTNNNVITLECTQCGMVWEAAKDAQRFECPKCKFRDLTELEDMENGKRT